MSETSWTLFGRNDQSAEAPGFRASRGGLTATWTRGSEGLQVGVDSVELANERLRVTVLPTRGMGLWRATCDGIDLGWLSPVRGPVHPQFVPLCEPSGLGWLDGFDEWLCRCGLASNGAPEFDPQGRLRLPLHGRIANRPAHQLTLQIDDQAGTLRLTGIVDESRFHFDKLRLTSTILLRRDSTMIEIEDVIENRSGSPAHSQMLYHINYGSPLLEAGCRLVAPVARVMPRNADAVAQLPNWTTYQGPQPGTPETVYFTQLYADATGQTEVMLVAPDQSRAAAVAFSIQDLPCFTVWKNETALADGYVTGLEPGTNYPNPRSFEQSRGRVLTLPPGGSHRMQLQLSLDTTPAHVEQRMARIAKLQQGRPTQIDPQPLPDWCAIDN